MSGLDLHEATRAELDDWDAHVVAVTGGDVYQSRVWAAYRGRHGWRPRFLVFDDGFRTLALERPWLWLGGASAYLSRGPIPGGEPAERTADRLRAAADWLAARGVDVVASDAEVPAASGYPALLAARGFRPIEEIQPSRHRLSRPLEGAGEDGLFASLATSVRQRVRGAEKRGLRVIRYDLAADPGGPGEGFEAPGDEDGTPKPVGQPALGGAADRLYDVLVETARRRGFELGPRDAFVDWAGQAIGAGYALELECRAPDATLLGAALFYRHGRRLTYSHAGDIAAYRQAYPGVIHLLLWRALQICCREGLAELDLAGVDVAGARRPPRPGEGTHGLLTFKEAFGGRWIELSGNHEWTARPWRYLAGRAAARLAALGAGRGDQR